MLSQGMTAAKLAWLLVDAKPGVSVLVHGAGGGVGTLLVQLLKGAKASVVAAAGSEEKLELALSLGADAAVNYLRDGWAEEVVEVTHGGVDYVLASAGSEQGDSSFDALRPGGSLVMFGGSNMTTSEVSQRRLKDLVFGNKRLVGFSAGGFRPDMDGDVQRRLFAELCDGKLKVVVGGRYPLSNAAQAHREMESRMTHGKLVLVP
jgi:NADPH2:quinone reductase